MPEIDRQHRRMIRIVNRLLEAVIERPLGDAEDQLLDQLVRLTRDNLRTEEAWMQHCGYVDTDSHVESHVQMLHEVVALRDGLFQRHAHLNHKAVISIRGLLEEHLSKHDKNLARSIRRYRRKEEQAGH